MDVRTRYAKTGRDLGESVTARRDA
jgi:hypothetical protein